MVTRVAVVSTAPVGTQMASPAIRALALAEALSDTFDVTIVAPGGAAVVPVLESSFEPRPLTRTLAGFDAVLAQQLPVATTRALASSSARLVFDLYTPVIAEALNVRSVSRAQSLLQRAEILRQTAALALGDAFVCPGERQRVYWLGGLEALRRLDLGGYGDDGSFRQLIDVVPFGLAETPPVSSHSPVLRGVHVGARDLVLLWAGGLVEWTDPFTVIRAVARLAERRPDVKLVVLGGRPPHGPVPATALDAQALARELGVAGRSVVFVDWVPHRERDAYLLEADVGVAAYYDTFENRLAYRARLVDHFWAGLPTATTRGHELADLIERNGLGDTVAAGDVDGWQVAIERSAVRDVRPRLEPVRDALAWRRVSDPLRVLLAQEGERRSARLVAARDAVLRARVSLALRAHPPSQTER